MANRQPRQDDQAIPEMDASPIGDDEQVQGGSDEEIRDVGEDEDDLDEAEDQDEEDEEQEDEGGM